VSEAKRKRLARAEKECDALRSQIEDTRSWLWNWEFLHGSVEDYLNGPPPGWEPTKLSDTSEGE
jgi:hypothetical protein